MLRKAFVQLETLTAKPSCDTSLTVGAISNPEALGEPNPNLNLKRCEANPNPNILND